MQVPDDLEAAVTAEMRLTQDDATPAAKSGGLMYFWAFRDFPGLPERLGYEDGPRTKALYFHLDEIVPNLIRQKRLGPIAAALNSDRGGKMTPEALSRTLGKSADLGLLGNLKPMIDARQWKLVGEDLGSVWP